jgi:hypothetical protein
MMIEAPDAGAGQGDDLRHPGPGITLRDKYLARGGEQSAPRRRATLRYTRERLGLDCWHAIYGSRRDRLVRGERYVALSY